MRLEKVRVQNYRCVKDSGLVNIEESITTFIGKNESGKTSFLKALTFFNPGSKLDQDDLCNFPGESPGSALPIVTLWLRVLEDDDKVDGPLTTGDVVEVAKFSDNSYEVKSPIRWGRVARWLEDYGFLRLGTGSDVFVHYSDIDAHLGSGSRRTLTEGNEAIFLLQKRGGASGSKRDTSYVAKKVIECRPKTAESKAAELVLDTVPKFVYLTNVDKIPDRTSREAFLAEPDKHDTLRQVLDLGGTAIQELQDARTLSARRKLGDAASSAVTSKIRPHWSQSENLAIEVHIEEGDIGVIVNDQLGSYTPMSKRSEGLQWYLAFLVALWGRASGELTNRVVLLDDPGVALHPSAQKDMRAMLEQLGEATQVLLTTHSPFLLDPRRLSYLRIVAREADSAGSSGTRVREASYETGGDALTPLRAAIGMTLGDALFASRHELIVSGITDFMIIHAMNSCLKQLDPRISLFPVTGDMTAVYFAKIFHEGDFDFVVLLDGDRSGREAARKLTKAGIHESRVISVDDAYGPGREVEIEDLFADDFYNAVVNQVYEQTLGRKIALSELDLSLKQTARYGKLFRENGRRFDKKPVAAEIEHLILQPGFQVQSLGSETISRFGDLFRLVNSRLPRVESTPTVALTPEAEQQ